MIYKSTDEEGKASDRWYAERVAKIEAAAKAAAKSVAPMKSKFSEATNDKGGVEELACDLRSCLWFEEHADQVALWLIGAGYRKVGPESVIVPREPTAEIMMAISANAEWLPNGSPSAVLERMMRSGTVYRAMIAASTPTKGETE